MIPKDVLMNYKNKIASDMPIDSSDIEFIFLPKSKNIYLFFKKRPSNINDIYDYIEEARNEFMNYGWYLTRTLIEPEVLYESD